MRTLTHRYALAFLTPALPFVPTVAITVNIYLIFKLSILTLVRFTIWMVLGLIMYFYYGITHSTLENPSEDIELTVDQTTTVRTATASGVGTSGGGDAYQPSAVWDRHGYENKMAEDEWPQSQFSGNSWSNARPAATSNVADSSRAWGGSGGVAASSSSSSKKKVPRASATTTATTAAAAPKSGPVPGGFGIFVDESEFPTWDD